MENGGAPYATTGTWSGTFATSGNAFTAAKITGDFVNISTTYTAAVNGTFTEVALPKIIEGQKPATLTLYTVSGVGHYEVSISDVFGVSLNGTFTLGAAPVTGPEITVDGGNFKDGKSQMDFVSQEIGKTTAAQIVTIENTGPGKLKNLKVVINGAAKESFKASAIPKTILSPGTGTQILVRFKPTRKAPVYATLHILSNDKDESSFDIKLKGEVRTIIKPFEP